jgi:hypothetical protein
MTAGQRAMAYAWIYPAAQHGGARKSKIGLEKPALADFPGVTQQRVSDARLIIELPAPVSTAGGLPCPEYRRPHRGENPALGERRGCEISIFRATQSE